MAEASVSPQFKEKALHWWLTTINHLPDISAITDTYTLPDALVYPGVEPAYPGALGVLIVFTRFVDPFHRFCALYTIMSPLQTTYQGGSSLLECF